MKNILTYLILSLGFCLVSSCDGDKDSNNKQLQYPFIISTWNDGQTVNSIAYQTMTEGKSAIDGIEQGQRWIEDEINCCVGLGGNPDRDGRVTLDASIMDHLGNIGGVGAIERIKHPITVARQVMEHTPHVLLVGEGAQQFALEMGHQLEPDTLSTQAAKVYQKWLENSKYKPEVNIENSSPKKLPGGAYNHDTMASIAMDKNGNMSGGVTTSGMGFKMRGRLGDSPVIGAGLFVDNEVGAATSTGVGEEVIKIAGSHLVVELMRQGKSPQQACQEAVHRIINKKENNAEDIQVGFIAFDRQGRYGAYAIQHGFTYCIKSATLDTILPAASYYPAKESK